MEFPEFSVASPLRRKTYQCCFYTLTTAISTRHSDTVDVKFLVNGTGVVIALPHAALAEFRQRSGRALTDPQVIRLAGLFLKKLLEQSEWSEEPLVTISPEETLALAEETYPAASRSPSPA